jgi:hypothetical protein
MRKLFAICGLFVFFQLSVKAQTAAQIKRINSLQHKSISIPQDGWGGQTLMVDMDLDGVKDRLIIKSVSINASYFLHFDSLSSYRSSLNPWGKNFRDFETILNQYIVNHVDIVNQVSGYQNLKDLYNTKQYDSIEYTYPLIQLGASGKIISPSDLIIESDKAAFHHLLKRAYGNVGITYINNDDYPDLILTSGNDLGINTALVLVSVGPLKYKLGNVPMTMPPPTSMDYGIGDLDNDQLPDIITEGVITSNGGASDSTLSYYKGLDVNGNFSTVKNLYTNSAIHHIIRSSYRFNMHDFDKDRFTDYISYMSEFRDLLSYPTSTDTIYNAYLNGLNLPTNSTTNSYKNYLKTKSFLPTIVYNNGNRAFMNYVSLLPSASLVNTGIPFTGRSIMVYDYNNDGYDDLFISMQEAALNMSIKDALPLKHWAIQYYQNDGASSPTTFTNQTDNIFNAPPVFVNSKIKEITLNKLFDIDGNGSLELFINNPDFRDVLSSNLPTTDRPIYYYKLNNANKFVLDSAYKNSSITGIKIIDSLGQITQCKYENRDPSLSRGVLIDQTPYTQVDGVGTYYLCNADSLTLKNLSDTVYGLKHRVHFFDTDKLRGYTLSGKDIKIAQPGNYQINLVDEYFCGVSANNPGIKIIKIDTTNEAKKLAPFLTINGVITQGDSVVCQTGNINDGKVLIGTTAPNSYKVTWSDLNVDLNNGATLIDTNKIKISTGIPYINVAANIYDANKCYYKISKIKITNQDLNYNPIKLQVGGSKNICYTDSVLLTLKKPLSENNITFSVFKTDSILKKSLKGDSVFVKEKGTYFYKVKYPNNCYFNTDSLFINTSLTIPAIPVISRDAENNLVSSHTGDNIWYKDGVLLSETASKIKPFLTSNSPAGNYSVKASALGCISALSPAYYYLITDIINLSATEYIKLGPNPFSNQIYLDFIINGNSRMNLEVVSMTSGNKVASLRGVVAGSPIFLGNLPSGIYLLKIISPDSKISHQFKVVKM